MVHHPLSETQTNGIVSTVTIFTLWTSILFSIGLSFHFPNTALYLLAVFIIGTCQRYLEELSHQANHRNLFKHTKLNDALDFFYAIPLFYTAKDTREEHYSHHLHLQEEQDKKNYSYDHLGISETFLEKTWYKIFIIYVAPFVGVQTFIELRNIVLNTKKYFFNCYIYHLIVIAILFYFHLASLYFFYWLVPYCTVFCVLYYYGELLTHFGCRGKYLSRDTDHWLVNGFIGPLGFCKYHSLHHISPKVPWFKYSRIKNDYEKNRQTLRQTLKSMFRLSPV